MSNKRGIGRQRKPLWNKGIICVKRLCLGIMAAARHLMCRAQDIL